MNEYEKLEYIHHIIQECMNNNIDMAMLETALEFVEDIRETFFKDGYTIRPNSRGYSTKEIS